MVAARGLDRFHPLDIMELNGTLLLTQDSIQSYASGASTEYVNDLGSKASNPKTLVEGLLYGPDSPFLRPLGSSVGTSLAATAQAETESFPPPRQVPPQ